jgi:hypothetical protein
MRIPASLALLLALTACGDAPVDPPRGNEGPGAAGADAHGSGASDVPPPPAPAPRDEAWARERPDASIFLAGAQKGKLKPCGCTKPQTGGMQRNAGAMDVARERAPDAFAAVSLGGTMAGNDEDQEATKAALYRAAVRALDYDALLLGVSDLVVDAMAQPLEGGGDVDVPRPPLNVRLRPQHVASATPPTVEFTVGTVPVIAFSLVGQWAADGLIAEGIAEAMVPPASAVQGLQQRPDTLWLVACKVSEDELDAVVAALARMGPAVVVDLDKVRGASTASGHALSGQPLVVSLDDQGKEAGLLDLHVGRDVEGGPTLTASYRAIVLTEVYEDHDLTPSPSRRLVDAFMARYREEVREMGYLTDFPSFATEDARFVGSTACARCHPGIYEDWARTPHGRALRTLREIDYHWDPECVRCHVVGFDRTMGNPLTGAAKWTRAVSGFVDPDRTQHLGGVGCESCHGPGSEHARDPYGARMTEGIHRVSKTIDHCVRCHDPDNSPNFLAEYERYLSEVDHRGVPSDRRTVHVR